MRPKAANLYLSSAQRFNFSVFLRSTNMLEFHRYLADFGQILDFTNLSILGQSEEILSHFKPTAYFQIRDFGYISNFQVHLSDQDIQPVSTMFWSYFRADSHFIYCFFSGQGSCYSTMFFRQILMFLRRFIHPTSILCWWCLLNVYSWVHLNSFVRLSSFFCFYKMRIYPISSSGVDKYCFHV